MATGYQGRVHPGLHLAPLVAQKGQQLDHKPEFAGELDVQRCQAGYALGGDVRQGGMGPGDQRSHDGQLVGGVYAFHVKGGVRLGQALGLGLLKHLGKGRSLGGHAGEDEVAGAV